jgi:hypothetical protein
MKRQYVKEIKKILIAKKRNPDKYEIKRRRTKHGIYYAVIEKTRKARRFGYIAEIKNGEIEFRYVYFYKVGRRLVTNVKEKYIERDSTLLSMLRRDGEYVVQVYAIYNGQSYPLGPHKSRATTLEQLKIEVIDDFKDLLEGSLGFDINEIDLKFSRGYISTELAEVRTEEREEKARDIRSIKKMVDRGMSAEDIADILYLQIDYVNKIIKNFNNH